MAAKRSMQITLLLCTLVLPTLASAQERYGGGYGTAERPYFIFGPQHLNAIGAHPEDWGKHFKLMYHVDMAVDTGTSFRMIGTDPDRPFTGVFDGNGYTIKNFTWQSTGTSYVGLFGYVAGTDAQIRNLGLVDPNIDAGTGNYVGSLVGHLDGGMMVNCYVEGGGLSGGQDIGGLVGCNSGTVTDCRSAIALAGMRCTGGLVGRNCGGEITCSYSMGTVFGVEYTGGLVGGNYDEVILEFLSRSTAGVGETADGGAGEGTSTIAECYSTSTVRGEMAIGGLVGFNAQVIANCYATGNVSGGHYCGGMLGYNEENAAVRNCYSIGQVTGDLSVGGFAGYSGSGTTALSFWDIETSGQLSGSGGCGKGTTQMQSAATFFGWDVCSDRETWSIDDGKDYPRLWWELAPGEASGRTPLTNPLTGSGTAEDPILIYTADELNLISLCSSVRSKHFKLMADIDLSSYRGTEFNIIGRDQSSSFTGVFDGNAHVVRNFSYSCAEKNCVGLFGCIDDPNAEIRNLGLIDPNIVVDAGNFAGPLVGYLVEGKVVNCFVKGGAVSGEWSVGGLVGITSLGTVRNSYATAAVSGYWGVGGLIGYNHLAGIVRDCYATGAVTARMWQGGLAGFNQGGVTECFWDIETSGRAGSAGGQGKTTAEMQQAGTFFAWGTCANEGIWVVDEGRDYPRLWWEGTSGQTIEPVLLSNSLAGTGTESDPFLIETPEQLNLIGRFPCEWDKHFRLMADLDISEYMGTEFNIIGTKGAPFTGRFDGGGHAVSTFSHASAARASIGLFGAISGSEAEVRDLGLVGASILAHGSDVGILAGYVEAATIHNCHVDGGVMVNRFSSTGGLVGSMRAGILSDCSATVDITSDGRCVGGLVGSNVGVVSNCRSSGNIRSSDTMAGGLVGLNFGEIVNCYSLASIEGTDYTGGLAGWHSGTIANCYTAGSVVGKAYTGGLAGDASYGEVVASFWDIWTSGQASSGGGTRLTTAQMQTAAPFLAAGWDFVGEVANGTEDIWWVLEGQDYPRLWWELLDDEAVE